MSKFIIPIVIGILVSSTGRAADGSARTAAPATATPPSNVYTGIVANAAVRFFRAVIQESWPIHGLGVTRVPFVARVEKEKK